MDWRSDRLSNGRLTTRQGVVDKTHRKNLLCRWNFRFISVPPSGGPPLPTTPLITIQDASLKYDLKTTFTTLWKVGLPKPIYHSPSRDEGFSLPYICGSDARKGEGRKVTHARQATPMTSSFSHFLLYPAIDYLSFQRTFHPALYSYRSHRYARILFVTHVRSH